MACTFESFFLAGRYYASLQETNSGTRRQVYENNRRHVYALSFRMTGNELVAERLMEETFRRAFSLCEEPSCELLDDVWIAHLRELMPLGVLSLNCAISTTVFSVRRNILRVHLEEAVAQLPAMERLIFLLHDVEGYQHDRIARFLELTESESERGLHQARLRLRELLAARVS